MKRYKIRVKNEAESKEAINLFTELGYSRPRWASEKYNTAFICTCDDGDILCSNIDDGEKEITIPQLRDLVVLKRNDVGDCTHKNFNGDLSYYRDSSGEFYIHNISGKWKKININGKCLKPIKSIMKEYLAKDIDGSYKLVIHSFKYCEDWIEIPDGAIQARFYPKDPDGLEFENKSKQWWSNEDLAWENYGERQYTDAEKYSHVVWQRETKPKKIPFGGVGIKTRQLSCFEEPLNDLCMRIEKIKQSKIKSFGCDFSDSVNNPQHYNKGGIECIDAIRSSMTQEAFCGYLKGNVQKYMWRYENKGGVESLKKAQWYLNKLIEVKNENSSKD